VRLPDYVLVTPARNEEAFIEKTIQSVVNQTVRPLRWIIVSDGSTDRTDDIVMKFVQQHDWMEMVQMPPRPERHFGGKVASFKAGLERLVGFDYEVIGSLDADLSFEPGYFEFLLGQFGCDRQLGIAGTPFIENGRTYDYRFTSRDHVCGACQLFRRACYEDIGGYVPIKGGGIDSVAVMTARMRGWRTRTFTEKVLEHHRPMGTADGASKMRVNFHLGQKAYRLGWHPAWQVVRAGYQMSKPPYIVGGAALLLGYCYSFLQREDRPLGQDVINFHRKDQIRRLRGLLRIGGNR
jgi:poly-beta-1,6-N-acetyl-D-glucosamine synthase